MNPLNRPHVAQYLSQVKPIEGEWEEKRLAYRMNGNVYLITDNFPKWTSSQIIDFLKTVNIKPFWLTVTISASEVIWEEIALAAINQHIDDGLPEEGLRYDRDEADVNG
jgi:hypothetical protein